MYDTNTAENDQTRIDRWEDLGIDDLEVFVEEGVPGSLRALKAVVLDDVGEDGLEEYLSIHGLL